MSERIKREQGVLSEKFAILESELTALCKGTRNFHDDKQNDWVSEFYNRQHDNASSDIAVVPAPEVAEEEKVDVVEETEVAKEAVPAAVSEEAIDIEAEPEALAEDAPAPEVAEEKEPDLAEEAVPEVAEEDSSDVVEDVQEVVPEAVPEVATEAAPEVAEEKEPDLAEEAVPEVAEEKEPDLAEEAVPEVAEEEDPLEKALDVEDTQLTKQGDEQSDQGSPSSIEENSPVVEALEPKEGVSDAEAIEKEGSSDPLVEDKVGGASLDNVSSSDDSQTDSVTAIENQQEIHHIPGITEMGAHIKPEITSTQAFDNQANKPISLQRMVEQSGPLLDRVLEKYGLKMDKPEPQVDDLASPQDVQETDLSKEAMTITDRFSELTGIAFEFLINPDSAIMNKDNDIEEAFSKEDWETFSFDMKTK